MSHWEDWQKEYRFGVLLIYPPEPLLSVVNALRDEYDPKSQEICDAHISLTVPLPRPMTDDLWIELEGIARGLVPFEIEYGPLMNYLPHPGVCLAIKPQENLKRLCESLEEASVFDGVPERKFPFSAHMTIAEFVTAEETLELMDELVSVTPTGSFRFESVDYSVPDEVFHFSGRRGLILGAKG